MDLAFGKSFGLCLKHTAALAAIVTVSALSSQAAIEPGDDDYGTISAAIEAAASGGTVELAAGTFYMTGTLTNKTDVTLKGAGKGETILCGAGYSDGRGLYVDNAAAVIQDLTVTGYTNATDGAGVYLKNGTLRNVAVTWCKAAAHSRNIGGGVVMAGGTMESCDILNNYVQDGYFYRWGGGVYMSGGTLTNCYIVGNKASGNAKNGGLFMTGSPTVRNCYIAQNSGNEWNSGWDGADGVDMEGGLLENSVVCSNGVGGVRISGGTMRNTLVFGNRHSGTCFAGVYNCGGTIQHCTVVGNSVSGDSTGKSGICQTSGTTVNSIFYGNGPDGSSAGSADVTGGKFQTNVVDNAVASGVGCLVTNPKFKDAANGNYRLGLGSPAVGRAALLAAVPKDLASVTRNADGKGADIGCYEYVPSTGGDIACAISIDSTEYIAGMEVVVKAIAEGGDGDYTYAWYLDDNATPAQTGSENTYTWNDASGGRHSVRVVVEDGSGHSDSASEPNLFAVRPLVVYVSPSGDDDNYPYDTTAKAARSLSAALAAVWQSSTTTATVHVAAGTYPITTSLSFSLPLRLLGAGASTTMIDSSQNAGRILSVSHKDVEVRGLTLANANANVEAAGLSMSAGLVADCVISNCLGYTMIGGGVVQSGGVISNTVITRCKAKRTGSGYTHGEGLYQTGGRVIGCLFRGNYAAGEYFNSLGAYTTGGSIENSVFTGHNGSSTGYAGTSVEVAGGSLINCLVYGNTCSLAYGRNTKRTSGVVMTSGKVIHCTITGNAASGSCLAASGLVVEGGTAVNNIVWGNTSAGGTAGVTVSGTAVVNTNLLDFTLGKGVGNLSGDPRFRGVSTNDYHLVLGSAAINAGSLVAGVRYDKDGVERNADGKGYELGCYEYVPVAGGPLTCSFTADKTACLAGDTVMLMATAEGGSGEGYVYTWYLDDGETPVQSGSEGPLVLSNVACGRHDVRLVVEDSKQATKEFEQANAFAVSALVAYADPNGSNTFPYETKAKAAHDVIDAYEAVWKTGATAPVLYIEPGTYSLSKPFVLDYPISIFGAGADRVKLDAAGTTFRVVRLDHDRAVVSGVTVANAKASSAGGGAYVTKGLLAGCVITNCTGYTLNGGGVWQDGGVISNTVITRCTVVRNNSGYNHGEGLYQTAGKAYGCTFYNNPCSSGQYSNGLGAYTSGGSIENSVFTAHKETPVMVAGGTLRNCLIAGNSCASTDASQYRKVAGVIMTGGKVINCTIAGNVASGNCLTAPGLVVDGGTAVNNIVWGNVSSNGTASVSIKSGATVNTNVVDCALASGVGNVNANPKFKHPSKGNYHLKSSSAACLDMGDNGVWADLATAKDLDGAPRCHGAYVDIGCYETLPSGLLLLVR